MENYDGRVLPGRKALYHGNQVGLARRLLQSTKLAGMQLGRCGRLCAVPR